MDADQRRALAALKFNWAPTPDDVWRVPDFHVAGLHSGVADLVLEGVNEARQSSDSSPIGVTIVGQRGSGKTHLLSAVRAQVQADGGYFFLVSLLEASAFWRSTALSILEGFARPVASGESQLKVFLHNLVDTVEAPRSVRRAVIGESELTRPGIDAFVDLIRKFNRHVGVDSQDTARALALLAAESPRLQDIAYVFLCSNDEEEPGQRAAWGMRRGKRSAQEIVRDMSRLLALTGPTVIAVDQIDLLIGQSIKATNAPRDNREIDWRQALLLEQIAGGLMSLRDTTRRTLSVVTCLPNTWQKVKTEATDTVQDRFREAITLSRIPSAVIGRELVEKRFAPIFNDLGFAPDYPTWPVLPAAFDEADRFTPRELLRTIDVHVRSCLASDEVRELDHLDETGRRTPEQIPVAPGLGVDQDFTEIDERFTEILARNDLPAWSLDTEDADLPRLLNAGLTAWIAEQGPAGESFSLDPPAGGKPVLHTRMRRSLSARTAEGDETEDEEHWAFRAICATHHLAALNRIRNAITAAGLTKDVTRRRLFLLRNVDRTPWSRGTRTQEVLKDFYDAGGLVLPLSDADSKRLAALATLVDKYGTEGLRTWFATRKPAAEIAVLRQALADAVLPATAPVSDLPRQPARERPAVADEGIRLGTAMEGGGDVMIGLESLRRHVAIFAGSGSGKTVLIRRLLEECALRGISAIVLDPNNDLARLADAWPVTPAGWGRDDPELAAEYLRSTEVVIWTPNWDSGRPLSFQPMPEFSDILNDPDAFTAGVDSAVAALAPHARVDGKSDKAVLGRAVLREALIGFARTGGNGLGEFIDMLNILPEGISQLDDAHKLGTNMAQLLKAATVNDPMFGGHGIPVDPGQLLTPTAGCRSRISVISFIGLPDDQQRQNFVNQLQISLFAWVKRHPAGDRPLGGLFIMDEAQTFAPSGAMTPCTQSTLALASQARKYGLGLIFATQAPKALHNRIPGNAATQFFGLLNSPTQIEAAKEMARAKGSDISDVARLGTGQFYVTVEGGEFVKLRSPLCLSYHPKSPLTVEEVIQRARPNPTSG